MTAQPALRCRGRGLSPLILRCGRPATHTGLDADTGTSAFFCERCTRAGDVPIGRTVHVREVRLTCEIVLCGVSLDHATARDEAARTVELAVGIAGGAVTVTAVSASLRPYTRRGAAAPRPDAAGEGV